MLRSGFLWLSKNKLVRGWVESSAGARRLTSRFIAGLTLDDGVQVAALLATQGIQTALDHLGENVETADEAKSASKAAEKALLNLSEMSIGGTIAIKLTQFGLDLSVEECVANIEPLVKLAKRYGTRVEVDMESTAYTERTLQIVERMQHSHGCVRAVIQAYLHRSEQDVRSLNSLRIPVRLCKGAYKESPELAIADKKGVDEAFVQLMRLLLKDGTDPAIATHDEQIIQMTTAYASEIGLAASRFEFEMLLGVRRDLQQKLIKQGYRLRLYVPYGEAWYPYFMRRLAERPANVWFLARNLIRN